MSFKFRSSKMSRNVSRHSGVSCDACGKGSFSGKRYKCLVCYDFDLCAECYEAGENGTSRHTTAHPMQCILTRVDADLFFGGENHNTSEQTTSFTCPLCGQTGFSESALRDHVTKQHSDPGMLQEVICPVCASHPSGDPNHLTDDLPTHLNMEHRAYRESDQDPNVVQSRVRRLIGRRRAGLDRFNTSMLSRDASQAHDYDPITDLLSQLSDRGAGAVGRRVIPADVPPHIQHLLEQQERQAFERSSPMRRPMCRRVLASGGSDFTDSPGYTYIMAGSGNSLYPSNSSKSESVEIARGFLLDTDTVREDKGIGLSKDPNSLLSSCVLPQLSEKDQETLEKQRADKSFFVQDLLLSTLAFSSESSSNETSDKEDT